MIIRTVHNKENPYFQLNRCAVNDDRLSYKAVGIHTYLMSKSDGWEANEIDIVARHNDGRSAVRSGIQELIDCGYMVRVQIRQDKKVVGWRLDTYETPELNPHYTPSEPPKTVVVDLDQCADLECENLQVENRIVDTLECDFLQVENLQVENRTHSNYIYTVNNENKKNTPPPSPSLPAKDPYMEQARKKFERRGRVAGWQAELNLQLDPKLRIPLVNSIAKACGLTAKLDGDDGALAKIHREACWFYEKGFTEPAMIDELHRRYLGDEWRRQHHPRPTLDAFVTFASRELEDRAGLPAAAFEQPTYKRMREL